jgi:hypothetical protein
MSSGAPEQLVRRIKSEYIEMPGLRLTTEQGARLWGIGVEQCGHVLKVLERRGFLAMRPDGQYGRPAEGLPPPRRMAKASLTVRYPLRTSTHGS